MTIVRKVRDGKFHSRIILNSHNVRVSEILAENVRGLPLDGFVTLVCRVTIRHIRVTVGHLRATMGHLRLTIGYFMATVVYIRVTLGHLRVTICHPRVTIGFFF